MTPCSTLVITAHAITAAHAIEHHPRIDTIISFIQDVISLSPSSLAFASRASSGVCAQSRPARRRRPPRTLTRRPHRSFVARDVTTIIAISLPPRARVERRRVTRVSSLDRLDRSRVASYLLTDSGSVLDGVSRAFSMDGWTCVCVSLPIGCVGRMDGWMRRVDGWMTPGARAFPRRVPSNARVVSSRLVLSRLFVSFPSRVTRRRGDPSSSSLNSSPTPTRVRASSSSSSSSSRLARARVSRDPSTDASSPRTPRSRTPTPRARRTRWSSRAGAGEKDVRERHRASRRVLVCGLAFARRVAWCLDDGRGRGRRARASRGRARARARARGRGGRRARRMTTTTTVGVRARGRGTTDAKTTTRAVRTRAGRVVGREGDERARGGEGVGGGRRRG